MEYNIDTLLEKIFKETDELPVLEDEEFQKKIERTLDIGEVFDLLDSAQQNKITIKEIVTEQSSDFVASCKELKAIFARELGAKDTLLANQYISEISKLKGILKDNLFGRGLRNILEAISPEWTFLLRKDKTVLYRCYNPAMPLTRGFKNDDLIEYEETIFTLQGIYVNVMDDTITSETIHLAGTGHHPAIDNEGYGSACPGSLETEVISLDKPEELRKLLDNICKTYEMMHVSTGYHKPDVEYEVLEEKHVWDSRAIRPETLSEDSDE